MDRDLVAGGCSPGFSFSRPVGFETEMRSLAKAIRRRYDTFLYTIKVDSRWNDASGGSSWRAFGARNR